MPSSRFRREEPVLGDLLADRAISCPGRTFLRFHEGELTYGEVDAMSNRTARGMAVIGVGQHDHVAVMMPNRAEFLFVIFALAKLGAVAVPINSAYKGDILRHVLTTSDATALIVDETLLDQAAPVLPLVPKLTRVVVATSGASSRSFAALPTPAMPLNALWAHGADAPRAGVRPGDLQAIMYTSGTTGPSKGVMVPHALGLIDAEDSVRYVGYSPEETIYCPLPLFHAAALWDGVFVAMLLSSSIAIVERFSASRFWDDVRRFGAHVAMGVFAMIPILMKRPPAPGDKAHPLRAFYHGKSALDAEFSERFGTRVVETYTSTEVGIALGSPYADWRAGSCGFVNEAHHEVRLVDEQDREVAPGEPGTLAVRPRRPFAVTPGYYNFPEATAHSFRRGWFHTGDLAYRDEDGWFYFLERTKDVIRRRGENISAFEVERIVNGHPDVLESAAFAVPSDVEEDELKIAVVPQPGATLDSDELAAYCEQHLPSFMVPRYIEFVDELPRSAIGKIAKHELRAVGDHGITARTRDLQQRRSRAE